MSYCTDDCCHPGKYNTGTISPQVRTHHMITGFLSSSNLRKLKAQGIATLGCVDTVFVKGSVRVLVVIIIRCSDAFCDCPNIAKSNINPSRICVAHTVSYHRGTWLLVCSCTLLYKDVQIRKYLQGCKALTTHIYNTLNTNW